MFLCSAKANDVRFIASLSVGHVHDDAIQLRISANMTADFGGM
jgi:hypothetical protein